MKNWLCEPGRNPYNLLPPPESFLRELAVFDDALVIMPSVREFGYWLLRRRKLTAGISTVLSLDKDSAVMVRHGLIPVTLFGGHITWGPQVLQWLRDRDTWHVGGGAKAADIYDEQDRASERQIQREIDSENDARARSAWRTVSYRNGSRVSRADVNRGRGPLRTRKRTGSAPVPPTVQTPPGWGESASGLVTPPTLR
jgi:hypothetical protein